MFFTGRPLHIWVLNFPLYDCRYFDRIVDGGTHVVFVGAAPAGNRQYARNIPVAMAIDRPGAMVAGVGDRSLPVEDFLLAKRAVVEPLACRLQKTGRSEASGEKATNTKASTAKNHTPAPPERASFLQNKTASNLVGQRRLCVERTGLPTYSSL